MIEDIKKEIRKKSYHTSTDYYERINLKDLFTILDKYKDIDKYKNAWEELKNKFNKYTTTVSDTMEELEQKHNIRKEDLDE